MQITNGAEGDFVTVMIGKPDGVPLAQKEVVSVPTAIALIKLGHVHADLDPADVLKLALAGEIYT